MLHCTLQASHVCHLSLCQGLRRQAHPREAHHLEETQLVCFGELLVHCSNSVVMSALCTSETRQKLSQSINTQLGSLYTQTDPQETCCQHIEGSSIGDL